MKSSAEIPKQKSKIKTSVEKQNSNPKNQKSK